MRNLLLASNGRAALDLMLKLAGPAIKNTEIAWITSAKKGVDDLTYLKNRFEYATKLGLRLVEIDLDDFKEESLRKKLNDYDFIFVDGGNPFYLLKAARNSGFDKVLPQLLKQGIFYIGASAGTYLLCPTIEMSTWIMPQRNRFGVKDFKALNQVPFLIKAHYNSSLRASLEEKIKESKYPLRVLRDGQAFLVKGDYIKFIGKGKEVRLS